MQGVARHGTGAGSMMTSTRTAVCVGSHQSSRSFYPSTSSTPSVRADYSLVGRYKLCGHKTTTLRSAWYYVRCCIAGRWTYAGCRRLVCTVQQQYHQTDLSWSFGRYEREGPQKRVKTVFFDPLIFSTPTCPVTLSARSEFSSWRDASKLCGDKLRTAVQSAALRSWSHQCAS